MATNRQSIGDDVFETWLSVRFELLKHLKRRRLLIVTALAILVPLLFYIRHVDTAGEFAANSLSFLSVLIVISAVMFAGDAICSDFERKTSLLLFPTPQKRSSIFAGKYVAALMATFLVVLLYYLTMTLQIAHLYGWGEIPTELAKSFVTALIYSTAAVSVAFFVSSLLKRSMSSTIVGFVLLIMILPVVAMILTNANQEPWFIVTYSSNLISDVLGVSSSMQIGQGHDLASSTFKPDFGVGIAVMVAYAIVAFVGGMAMAIRKSEE